MSEPYGPPPQYGTPPSPPQYGPPPVQPTYPAQPTYPTQPSYPTQPLYPTSQPTYPTEPSYGGLSPYGFPPDSGTGPTPRRKSSRTSLWIAIGVVLVILLGGGIAAVKLVLPDLKERNAHVALPPSIGALVQSTDPDDLKEVASLRSDLQSAEPNVDELVAALYQDPARPTLAVLVLAATVNISDPGEVLGEIMSPDNVGVTLTGVHAVDAGPLGGSAQCGSGDSDGVKAVFCGWSDHGSIGEVLMFNRDDASAATLFGQIHNLVLTRG